MRCVLILICLFALVACGAAQAPATPDPTAGGKRLYTMWCIACHAVQADAPGGAGPNLAGVATRAAANPDGLSAAAWLRRELVNPNAVLTQGYRPGFMPTSYGQTLRPDQLDALVAYMLTLQ